MHADRRILRHLPRIPETGLRRHVQRGPWLHLLSQVLQLAGPEAAFVRHCERPWSSATFAGWRHTIALSFTGEEAIEAGEDFVALLPDHEFAIPGQIVADATITQVEHCALPEAVMHVELEMLLLLEA